MEKKFYLSKTDKKIAGVCGGLAEYFGVSSLVLRVLLVLAVWFCGVGLLAYILLWIIAPKHP